MTTECCAKSNIVTLKVTDKIINRVCLHCETHWFGDPDFPVKYTRKEWDLKIEQIIDSIA